MLGFGIGLGFANLMGSAVFSPASLFSGGEAGVWYDPSDLSTLFQDTAGTTPVTTAGQTVGLMLDKSQGLTLGPELAPATDAADWTAFGTNTATDDADGSVLITYGDNQFGATLTLSSLIPTIVDASKVFKITYEAKVNTGSALVRVLNFIDNTTNGPTISSSTYVTHTFIGSWDGGGGIELGFNSLSAGESINIRNISVKELPGYHATQATGSFSPRYQVTPERLAFDGIDDRFAFPLNPTTSGTIAVRMNSTTASKIAVGVQGATDGRCYIGLASDGSLAGGIGAQATSVIKGAVDKRSTWVTGILTWDGATVSLYQDGVSVYSAAQSGAVTTTVPFIMGGLNNNGTATAFHTGDIGECVILDRVMTPTEITETTAKWSTIE